MGDSGVYLLGPDIQNFLLSSQGLPKVFVSSITFLSFFLGSFYEVLKIESLVWLGPSWILSIPGARCTKYLTIYHKIVLRYFVNRAPGYEPTISEADLYGHRFGDGHRPTLASSLVSAGRMITVIHSRHCHVHTSPAVHRHNDVPTIFVWGPRLLSSLSLDTSLRRRGGSLKSWEDICVCVQWQLQ